MGRTLKAAIEEATELKRDPFSTAQKTAWINTLEGRIQTDIWLRSASEIVQHTYPEEIEGEDTAYPELLVEPPHDDIYVYWLCAMIDWANGEYSKYNNSMLMFNALFGTYLRWFAATYEPAQAPQNDVELGSITYDRASGEAVELYTLPRAAYLLRVSCRIETAFDSGTSDELTLGTISDTDNLMESGDIDASVPGTYSKACKLIGGQSGTKLYVTLTKTGTDATAGTATFFGRVLLPRR